MTKDWIEFVVLAVRNVLNTAAAITRFLLDKLIYSSYSLYVYAYSTEATPKIIRKNKPHSLFVSGDKTTKITKHNNLCDIVYH